MSSVSSGSARIRCSITGITTTPEHLCSSIAASAASGSNLRRSTIVWPSSSDSIMCAKPHVWNSGAAMCTVQPWRSGIRESREMAASMPASLRGAPFGVPVVPEVRMMIRVWCSGGSTGESSDSPSISASRVSVGLLVGVRQHPLVDVRLLEHRR